MEQESTVRELFRRRVPQFLGLYVAATWMMIEIGDWMIDRFGLNQYITSYIFIGMAFFLPSVIYLAYQYGKPGKDPFQRPTYFIVPTNLLVAIAAMFYLVEPVVATETKIVIDEKGNQKAFEVSKNEYRNNIAGFFWQNKSGRSDLDWMQYGIAWLLAKDLDRSLFISAETPFDSDSMRRKMAASGFKDSLNIPKSLQLELARGRFQQYSLDGAFNYINERFELSVDVYNVALGKKIASHSVSGVDIFSVIDELTVSVKGSLKIPPSLSEQTTDLPVKEHISESLPAIEKLIKSKLKRQFENDYVQAIELLDGAIALDFSFAHAYTQLARTHRLSGNSRQAQEALKQALKHEYKLTPQEKFRYRGASYGIRGDYESQVKVYDMWLELFPDDITAHESMANILLATGLNSDKALVSLYRLRQLNPEDDSVLTKMTNLFVLNTEFDKAIESQSQYVALNPQDHQGLISLADVHSRLGDFASARKSLERVLLLEPDNLVATTTLAFVDMKQGNFDAAQDRLQTLLSSISTPQQRFEVLQSHLIFYAAKGQIKQALATIADMESNAEHLPPLLRIFNMQFTRSLYLASLGQFEASLAELDNVRSQLQPPLDGIIDVGVVSVYTLAEDEKKLNESLEKMETYIKKFPNPLFSSALDSAKAQAKRMTGDYHAAVKLHEESLEKVTRSIVNTENQTTILNQQVLLSRSRTLAGDPVKAEEELLEVIKIFPAMAQAHVGLAESYLAQGKNAEAVKSLNQVADIWQDADTDYLPYQEYLKIQKSIKKAEN